MVEARPARFGKKKKVAMPMKGKKKGKGISEEEAELQFM